MQHRHPRLHKVAPVYLFALIEEIESKGGDPCALCTDLSFGIADLLEPGCLVSHHDACTWIRRALRLLPDPHIGFELGQRSSITARGPLALGIMASKTLREAFALKLQYPASAGFLFEIEEEVSKTNHTLCISSMFGNHDLMTFLSEKTFASMVRLSRLVTQTSTFAPNFVDICHEVPASRKRQYEQYFRCKVNFDAPSYRLGVHTSWLDFALPFGNLPSYRLARRLLDQATQTWTGAMSIEAAVIDQLRKYYRRAAPFADVAAALNFSERTLRRRLTNAGVSFQSLLDEYREDRVLELVRQNRYSLADIATQTGFANVSSLRRAFRRWTGRSLVEHRKAMSDGSIAATDTFQAMPGHEQTSA